MQPCYVHYTMLPVIDLRGYILSTTHTLFFSFPKVTHNWHKIVLTQYLKHVPKLIKKITKTNKLFVQKINRSSKTQIKGSENDYRALCIQYIHEYYGKIFFLTNT